LTRSIHCRTFAQFQHCRLTAQLGLLVEPNMGPKKLGIFHDGGQYVAYARTRGSVGLRREEGVVRI